jgi:hypothetical protein
LSSKYCAWWDFLHFVTVSLYSPTTFQEHRF